MISVYVIARIRSYRDALQQFLARTDGIEIVGAAGHPAEALLDLASLRPDVLLLDVPDDDGPAWARELAETAPHVRMIAVGVREDEADFLPWAQAGVAGFVGLDACLDTLVAAVEAASRGEAACSPRAAAILLHRIATVPRTAGVANGLQRLTTRECEIVGLIGQGLSNQQMARRLCIALPTVKNHVHNVLEKLGVSSRHEAVLEIRRRGFMLRDTPSAPDDGGLVTVDTRGDLDDHAADMLAYARSRRASPSSLRMPVTKGTSSLV